MKGLRLDDIWKTFGGLQALCNVSLEVEVGERRALLGPNGAGKTTLFHVITGVLQPTRGTVWLFGDNITGLPTHRRVDRGISQTFQIINLFKGLTVIENAVLATQALKQMEYILYRRLSRCNGAMHEAEQLVDEWGFWEKRDVRVADLSYGDQRLLDIALALARKPRVLLLDEPASGLSLGDVQKVVAKVKELSREITILLIEHNVDVALSVADTVTVLHMGQIVAEGTTQAIREDPRVKEIYLGKGKVKPC